MNLHRQFLSLMKLKTSASSIDWISSGLPFGFCEDSYTAKYTTLKPKTTKTYKKDVTHLAEVHLLRASSNKTEICFKRIPPTSNLVERFFSQAIFTDYRLVILPQNSGSQLFLHFNRQFWGPETIQNILAELSDQ